MREGYSKDIYDLEDFNNLEDYMNDLDLQDRNVLDCLGNLHGTVEPISVAALKILALRARK